MIVFMGEAAIALEPNPILVSKQIANTEKQLNILLILFINIDSFNISIQYFERKFKLRLHNLYIAKWLIIIA